MARPLRAWLFTRLWFVEASVQPDKIGVQRYGRIAAGLPVRWDSFGSIRYNRNSADISRCECDASRSCAKDRWQGR